MTPQLLLFLFLILRTVQHLFERRLARLNYLYYSNPERQKEAATALQITSEDMEKSLRYSRDKYHFNLVNEWFDWLVFVVFLAVGGFGWLERLAHSFSLNPLVVGLVFFAILALFGKLLELPFEYYFTFRLEEKHGFNRQTVTGFISDQFKALAIGVLFGGLLLAALLYVIDHLGKWWWVFGWGIVSFFSIFTAWIYPTLLAPLFNKFKPLEPGDLQNRILDLSKRIGFRTNGLFVMDASRRSAHGNAYFTGLFGKKRIVLFDTLMEMLNANQIVAVLAHELGHFKLHHVRWAMIRGVFLTGLVFYLLSLCLPIDLFYRAFFLKGVTAYGALLVFGLWFGIIGFVFKPVSSWISRRNEFAADRFAIVNVGNAEDLKKALLRLREKSQAMPLTHPLFSLFYHSHPPILERIKAM